MNRDTDAPTGRDVSRAVLRVFAPILIVVGILGFLVPARRAATSGAPAYNVFHLVFGALGIACARQRGPGWARTFNVGFGALDLYQALASRRGWFPQRWFRWRPPTICCTSASVPASSPPASSEQRRHRHDHRPFVAVDAAPRAGAALP